MGSELSKALAAVQADLPAIAKGAKATIPGKDGRQGYNYDYADLADVSEAILPLLGKNGLAFTAWPTLDDGGRFVLAYALIHESGEERTGIYPLPSQGRPQDIGAAITYARRYTLCAVTGVAPGGEDNDAAGATEVHMDRGRTTGRPPSDVPSRPTVPGPRTGPEHEQHRHGTVEWTPDDKPTAHGPLPDEDNPWLAEPPEEQPGTADPGDVKGIQIAYGKLGLSNRQQALNVTQQLLGRPLTGPNAGTTHKNLSSVEAKALKKTLEGFDGDRGALMERLTGITQAVAAVGAQDGAEAPQDPPGGDGA